MWLLTAIGPVHGQLSFTFALEQRRTYSVGRDKSCDIRYENRYVKPVHGSVIVGDWDPTNPSKQPEIRWKSEPNKKGVHPAFRTVIPNSPEEIGSVVKEDYAVDEIPEGTPGCFLNDNGGMGIELGEGCWFTVHWEDLSLCYDKMKDEPETTREALRRYCMTWSPKFEEGSLPDLVISPTFRGSAECNCAVIYGIRIVTPGYLEALLHSFTACWKKIADNQDSFTFPDAKSQEYRPKLDSGLPNVRNSIDCFQPDPSRKTLFQGWKIMGLKNKSVPVEKRWLVMMGADYSDIDISRTPPKTPEEFAAKVQSWVEEVDAEGRRDQALVVHFMRVKEEFTKASLDFNAIVGTACQGLGVIVCSGNVTWGAVREGGVQAYIDAVRPDKTGLLTSAKPNPQPVIPSVQAPAPPPASQNTPLPSSSATQPASQLAIPSTFPDETESTKLVAPPSAHRGTTPDSSLPEGRGVKKPLRRRAAKKLDLFAEDLSIIPETHLGHMDLDISSPVSQTRPEVASQATQPPETQGNSLAPKSRLKRRAGPDTQRSQFNFDFDESFDADRKAAETAAEIRELYEQTKAESTRATQYGPPPSKKQKMLADVAENESLDSDNPMSLPSNHQPAVAQDIMDLDEDAEEIEEIEDPIQRTLRKAREAKSEGGKKAGMTGNMAPPPTRRAPPQRSPSEEPEMVEVPKKSKSAGNQSAAAKQKADKTAREQETNGVQPTRDTAFLQAITKASKTKMAVDELDREFNNLRIPKPNGKTKDAPVETNGLNYDHPDWNLVDDFNDDLRGNFIQIVRKDLFRKDKPLETYERPGDGRPNYKKFKKKSIVRKDPVRLFLAGPTLEDAEMGEPYWTTENMRPNKRSQGLSQMQGTVPEDDEMPLLPSTKKRLLKANDESDEDQPTLSSRRKAPRSQVTDTQDTSVPTRGIRAASVASAVSEVSSVPSMATRVRPTKAAAKPAASARGKGKKAPAIVVEDSEEEVALDLDRTPAPSASTKSPRGTRATGTSTVRGAPTPSSGTHVPDTSMPMGSGKPSMATGTATATRGGRRLLAVDDDEEDVPPSKGLQKKRRIR